MEQIGPKQAFDLTGRPIKVGDTVAFGGSGYMQIATVQKIKSKFKESWDYAINETVVGEELDPVVTIKATADSRPFYDRRINEGKGLNARGGVEGRRLVVLP